MISKLQGTVAQLPQVAAKKTVFDRPPLRPMPKYITERLNPDFHSYSLATPIDELRDKYMKGRIVDTAKASNLEGK